MKLSVLPLLSFNLPAPSSIYPRPLLQRDDSTTKTIPSEAVIGDIVANFLSTNSNLDGPQLSGINTTSFDWWYFDVISPDLNSSLVVVFFTALDSGFPFLPPNLDTAVISVFYSFPNGELGTIWLNGSEAIVTTDGDSSSGQFPGCGANWTGSPDLSHYQVTIDSPENNISGTFDLTSLAPAHYPCGPVEAGQTMMVAPHIGWSNAMPDAVGVVDFKINGNELAFEGVAYHDKNWSDQPFGENVNSWYWGHGRLGNYSIVWFDTLATDGSEYVSAYASLNGKVVTSSCQAGGLKVRPAGVNDQYPPSISEADPDTFTIELYLVNERTLRVNITIAAIIADGGPAYKRWSGSMTGRVCCEPLMTGGVALLEQFKLVA